MGENRQILILFAHPAVRRSRVNRRLIEAVRTLDGLMIHDLYETYPDFDIDVAREQELLAAHDLVVFQHPFYWYSTPAILKEWLDLVLEHGWAYGRDGNALEGKTLMSATTTGGAEDAYCHQGANRFFMRELLAPIEQTARLCGMEYLPPFVVHGTFQLTDREIDHHGADYRRSLEALRDGTLDLEAVQRLPRLNSDLDAVVRG
ncbi:MAG: NAD(P)H-dependent oxidoreductase [Acidobacteria bacterium]|nr:NAD(P)H-dependent oxidoreductase [Acidobacteriota bacterium]